jgi:hypothetical protein
VKFEIVSERRIRIDGAMDPATGVPTLAHAEMYAEKVLANANADWYRDKAVPSRGIIDLAMMIGQWVRVRQHSTPKCSTTAARNIFNTC